MTEHEVNLELSKSKSNLTKREVETVRELNIFESKLQQSWGVSGGLAVWWENESNEEKRRKESGIEMLTPKIDESFDPSCLTFNSLLGVLQSVFDFKECNFVHNQFEVLQKWNGRNRRLIRRILHYVEGEHRGMGKKK